MAQQPKRTEDAAKQQQLEEGTRRKEEAVAEQTKRLEGVKPTPTQAENDAAALGILIDEKEDHGGEDEAEALQRTMQARVGEPMSSYQTRAVQPARPGSQAQPARREERPREEKPRE
jgi:hypothetical protein